MQAGEDPTAPPGTDTVTGGDDADDVAAKTRRRAPGADPEVRSFGTARTCSADGCETQLSRYNPDSYCSVHRGWDRQVVTRRRRTGSNGVVQNGA
ncbi:MAG TPA: hypothetical protein VNK73_13060 [Actinomycetota bacterium]|nr:hypothetical protein [Actinomycetota bacterium]